MNFRSHRTGPQLRIADYSFGKFGSRCRGFSFACMIRVPMYVQMELSVSCASSVIAL